MLFALAVSRAQTKAAATAAASKSVPDDSEYVNSPFFHSSGEKNGEDFSYYKCTHMCTHASYFACFPKNSMRGIDNVCSACAVCVDAWMCNERIHYSHYTKDNVRVCAFLFIAQRLQTRIYSETCMKTTRSGSYEPTHSTQQ